MGFAVAPRGEESPSTIRGSGIGLRLPHLAEVAAAIPSISWLEIHPENFLANPHAREMLQAIAQHYPISMHTVGISVGSADGIDRAHLVRLKALIDEIDPALVSGHLAWSTYGGNYLNDLLPIPYNAESLALVADQVAEVQDTFCRAYVVENPASYVGFSNSTLTETEFLGELVARTGCRLLCDVSNLIVNGANLDLDPYAYIDEFPADSVAEIHLGGFAREPDPSDEQVEMLIDTHDAPIAQESWELYAYAIGTFGARPTLIEWDNALPDLGTLLREADRATEICGETVDEIGGEHSREVAAHAAAG